MVNVRFHVEEWNNVLDHALPSVHLAEMETVNLHAMEEEDH